MEFDNNTLSGIIENASPLVWVALISILKAVVVYFAGKWVIGLVIKAVDKIFKKSDLDASLSSFLKSFIRGLLYVLLILAILATLGVEVTAFIAVLGAAGLAIGLALQGSLANFAGGVLILVFKPFKIGDTVEAQGILGSVEKIDILYTTVRQFDNKVVTVPNGNLANNNITNYSEKPTRRVEMAVGVAYGTDLKVTRKIILDTLKKDDRIHADPAPAVYFTNFGDNSLDLSVRCWADAGDLWPVFWDNMENIKEALEEKEIEVPFPQRDVHHYFPEGNPELKSVEKK
ncbi:mechanosensitive ion channel family protein [Cyclobacterium qasimii]|uniref:Potassium efflux system KefA protein n=2 Tax=Cyclobacterium qasimii TaxID=1350429 RepID=S7WQN4_9BACT|nr:mechanosensitive ion channel domain-containing protein [Cyclobacterium qasimii]EPR66443.1 Potassium efflux system KefA protein [Cyclobacterium qasimii M12-11B]GEO21107.1 mechanosensitive ion channel protein [Cyclobacterium qasimii]